MKFYELWEKFEKSGNIEDYLQYCLWNDSVDVTGYVTSENVVIESGDLCGYETNSHGVSA